MKRSVESILGFSPFFGLKRLTPLSFFSSVLVNRLQDVSINSYTLLTHSVMLDLSRKSSFFASKLKSGTLPSKKIHRPRTLFGWMKGKPEQPKEADCGTKGHVHGPNCGHGAAHAKPAPVAPQARGPAHPIPVTSNLKNIKHIVAVSSGKGGVGKSTVAVNLAIATSQLGKRVALLDADIYGPSIPTMMNLVHEKPKLTERNQLIPLVNYGVELMSIGFLLPQDAATIWRGPMVMSAIDQMLHDVAWAPDTDLLVIDMPPGTGDAQISISQRTPLDGAIIISTPQEVALADVRRGANMFRKVNVPLLGLVENMSYFKCGNCDAKHYIFGQEGAQNTAKEMDIDVIGEIPIDQSIRELCDKGKPTTAAKPDSEAANLYREIAQRVLDKISSKEAKTGPKIIIED